VADIEFYVGVVPVLIGGFFNLAIFLLLCFGPTQNRLLLVPLSLLVVFIVLYLSAVALKRRTRRSVIAALLALLLSVPLLIMYASLVFIVIRFAIHGDI